MTSHCDDTFESFLVDVVPIESKQRAVPAPGAKPPTIGQANIVAELNNSSSKAEAEANYLADYDTKIEMLCSEDETYWCETGVQEGVLERLKSLRYRPESELDLHEKTVPEARKLVWVFIGKCLKLQYRTVRIVHGRGNPANPPSRLKSFVAHWMSQHEGVIAACTPRGGGGPGELLVRLRKQRTKNEAANT